MFKDLLNKYNISAYKLSKYTKIPYTTISELNTNKRTIDKCSASTLRSISEYLNTSMENVYDISTTIAPIIPQKFKDIFWDSDFDLLDYYKNKYYIITRLITKGGIDGFLWAINKYDDFDLIDATKNSRLWDMKSANYMSMKYDIDKNEMAYYNWNKKDWK